MSRGDGGAERKREGEKGREGERGERGERERRKKERRERERDGSEEYSESEGQGGESVWGRVERD